MFGVTSPGHSSELLEDFIQIEKQLFQELGLHFRFVSTDMLPLKNY